MASWWNGKLMKWQVNEMASWWNGKLMKWQVDEMASWWNNNLQKMSKKKVYYTPCWLNGKLVKWQVDKMAGWQNGSSTKQPGPLMYRLAGKAWNDLFLTSVCKNWLQMRVEQVRECFERLNKALFDSGFFSYISITKETFPSPVNATSYGRQLKSS